MSHAWLDAARGIDAILALLREGLWFQPSLWLALRLLELNRRDEAGRFEPLDEGENISPLRRVPTVAWNSYENSAIIVPGLGPEQSGVALASSGLRRVALASENYRRHLAPFIVVSGGYVHPAQTPYCEAIEMRRALINDFGVPADAIIVEPQARHTTTNLPNATRLMFRYDFPLAVRKVLLRKQHGIPVSVGYQLVRGDGLAIGQHCDGCVLRSTCLPQIRRELLIELPATLFQRSVLCLCRIQHLLDRHVIALPVGPQVSFQILDSVTIGVA